MLHERSDEELMRQVMQGHGLAYEVLVRRHIKRAYAVAVRVCGNPAEAEDIAQEAFTKLWVSAATWKEGKAKFSTWFYRIIVNECMDRLRARKPTVEIDAETMVDARPNAEKQLGQSQMEKQVKSAVDALPDRQRLAMSFCYYEGFSNQQAADIMGMNIKALEGLLVRAKKTLRHTLKSVMEEEKAGKRYAGS